MVIAACRPPAPAGPEVTTIGNGQVMIRAEADDGEGVASQEAYRRANELCPSGYQVVDSRTGVVRSYERVAVFGRRVIETPEVTLVVRCTPAHP